MLLPDNVHPQNSIFFNGAFVLKAIPIERPIALMDLYLLVQEYREISMPVFVLCLDWLYLIGLIHVTDRSEISLCS